MSRLTEPEYDLTRIIAKPLYFGLFSNIMAPMAVLLVIYFIHNGQGWAPLVSESMANTLFYALAFVAVVHAGLVVWWRKKAYASPMVRRRETFEADFAAEYLRRTRPLFLAIGAVSLYGFVYYFLTGRFNESLMFVVFSFLVFQLVRPRYGLVQKLIDRQTALVEKGEFRG